LQVTVCTGIEGTGLAARSIELSGLNKKVWKGIINVGVDTI
jgi:hypothetical protein